MNQENQAASTVAAKINNQELVIISENANSLYLLNQFVTHLESITQRSIKS